MIRKISRREGCRSNMCVSEGACLPLPSAQDGRGNRTANKGSARRRWCQVRPSAPELISPGSELVCSGWFAMSQAACGGKRSRGEVEENRSSREYFQMLLTQGAESGQASRPADLTRYFTPRSSLSVVGFGYQKISAWRFTRSPCCLIACNSAFDGARQSSRRARSCSSSRRSAGAANATLTCSFARQNR
jgi:hypothetical protein